MIVRRSSRTRPSGRTAAAPLGAAHAAGLLLAWAAASILCVLALAAPASAADGKEHSSYRTEALPAGTTVIRAGAARAGGGSARTTRIDLAADARFSLAALRWTGRQGLAGRLRAQRTDGTWTAWTTLESERAGADGVAEGTDPAAASAARQRSAAIGRQGSTEPIWTGPARRLVVELRGPRPKGLRAAFVDVTGKLPTVTARAARARQAGDMAGIRPRSDWDPGNECAPRAPAALGSVQAVTVHHTAGSNAYAQAQVPAVLLAICKYHRNANGWNDIGYNVLVDRYGGAWEGRAGGLTNAVIGAHAQGFNSVSAGVSMIGDFTAVAPPPAQVATVARVAAWKLAVAGVPRTGDVELTSAGGSQSRFGAGRSTVLPRVYGHRDVGQTACPGNVGYTIMDGLRASVAAANPSIPTVVPPTAPTAPLPPAATPTPKPIRITISTKRRLDVGASAVVTGTAKQGTAPLKAADVALQVGLGQTWQTVARTRTNTAGQYRFTRKFSRSWKVRVARAGGDGASTAVSLVVVPKLTLRVPKRMKVNKAVTLRGTIAPGRGPVTLTVERRASNGKYVAGKTQAVKLRGRVLTVRITPHSLALYRFRLVYAGSELAAPARSALTFGRVVSGTASGGGASVG